MWRSFFRAVRRGEYKVSGLSWAALVGAVIYTVSPIDLVPELFLPIVGYVDDLGLWGVMTLLLNKEKQQWLESLQDDAIDVTPKRGKN